MRWRGRRRSANVEDRRGRRTVRRPIAVGGCGLFLFVAIALLLGADPGQILQLWGNADPGASLPDSRSPEPVDSTSDETADFISVVLADTEETWTELLAHRGARYVPPTLVLFTDSVSSACGFSSAAVGPFYCPADRKIYIDLSFYRDLDQRFGAPGDFAQAYVLAHEVGHHIQNLLGIAEQVHELRQRLGDVESNALSVQFELQADCLAGVWGHHAGTERQLLEEGDIEEGLRAAAAIGDDRMQRAARGYVNPESWTHGSSEQRVDWLRRGLRTGNIDVCNTF